MAFSTRNSVLAIKKETTEGSPIKPTSGADGYLALQDGFTMTPSFEVLESAELQSSIGKAKSTLGVENPSASISHYLRPSFTEGVAPNFGLLLETALGSVETNATEYDTVAGSTTSVLNVDAGEGATFSRGEALLIKDATNGYSIRNVYSVATDALTLGFNVGAAPASAVNLGKAVFYKPENTHPTFTTWLFRGDGGAIEAMAGSRVTEFSISVEAGQFVNASFSVEGTSYYFDPLLVDATNNKINFKEGAGELTATITSKLYKDPIQLQEELQIQLNAVATANITVTYSNTTGKYTIVSDGATFQLLWKTGTNGSDGTDTHIGTLIGFSDAADDTGALTYTSDNAIGLGKFHTPTYDTATPLVAKNNQVLLGDATDTTCFEASSINITCSNTKADVLSVCAESGKSASVITQREVTVEISALLTQYQANFFKKFRSGDQTRFCYNFGEKTGTNWTAGRCANVFIPTATITNHELADQDSLVALNMTLSAYVDSSLGEFYINFL